MRGSSRGSATAVQAALDAVLAQGSSGHRSQMSSSP
jgi:hypothetical protein